MKCPVCRKSHMGFDIVCDLDFSYRGFKCFDFLGMSYLEMILLTKIDTLMFDYKCDEIPEMIINQKSTMHLLKNKSKKRRW